LQLDAIRSVTSKRLPRNRTSTFLRALLALVVIGIPLAGRAHPAAAQFAGGVNASLTPSTSTAAVGQQVNFTYSATPPAVAPPFPSITSVVINYGDGQSDLAGAGLPGQTVAGVATHVYTSPGSYTATLSVTASNGASGGDTAFVTVGGGSGPIGGVTVSVSALPPTAQVGLPITFAYSATPSSTFPFPTIRSMLISYGDGGAPLPLNPPSGSVTRTYTTPGIYNVLVTATDSNGAQGQGTTTVQVVGGGPIPPISSPPSNVAIINPPAQAIAGQAVSFNAATAFVNTPGAVIASYTWNYSDGGSDFGQSVTHIFASPGTYSVTLTVTDSTGASAQDFSSILVSSGAPPPAPGVSVTYQSGWNLVAAPTGSTIPSSGPLYTFQNGNTAYQTVQSTQAGFGYWAFFNSATTVTIPFTGPQTITRALQPGQFIMIGNSSSSTATVTGADIVYIFSPATNYTQTTVLQPGQGAWAMSFNGGNVTIASTGR
jgi:PKD repeat protein